MVSSTVAILLGASDWPKSKGRLPGSPNFLNSARDFRKYLVDANGLSIPEDHLLDLFDSDDSPSEIDEQISDFLSATRIRLGASIENIILYYIGHGAFAEDGLKYCIALRSTRAENLGGSAYRFSALARTLNMHAGNSRRFVILDACFAAAASGEMMPQSQHASLAEDQVISVLAESGTALLCAASSSEAAISPKNRNYTMFGEALLHALTADTQRRGSLLSFDDIRSDVKKYIEEHWRESAVNPELHIPDQRKGDISKIAFFPNIFGRLAIQQADRLQALSTKTDAILNSVTDLFKRLERVEDINFKISEAIKDRVSISQMEEVVQRRMDERASEGVPGKLNNSQPTFSEDAANIFIGKYRRARFLGRYICGFASVLALVQLTLLIVIRIVGPKDPSIPTVAEIRAVRVFLDVFNSNLIACVVFFAALFLSLLISRHETMEVIELSDFPTHLHGEVHNIKTRGYSRLYRTYLVETQLVAWGLAALLLGIGLSLFSWYMGLVLL